jgi:lipopolysaccharide transport system permease protein
VAESSAGGSGAGAGSSVVIRAERGFAAIDLAELWQFRELIGFLALRDVKVRYKQASLGIAWAILQPLLTMVVFSVIFGLLMGADHKPTIDGVPYAVSTYCALVPWQLFATSLGFSGNSLIQNQHLITKVYFPRLVLPIAPIVAALVDFAAAFAVLLAMMLWYGITPGPAIVALPCFILLAVATALAVSLWLAALNALYRDVRYALPLLTQIWFFVTPVVYTTASVLDNQPSWMQLLYALNPMAGVIEGFRWALLGSAPPAISVLLTSGATVALLLVGGAFYFRRMERIFADWV